MYDETVGGNVTLLINIPPDRTGRFHATDVARLGELGTRLRKIYGQNFSYNFGEASLLNVPGVTVVSAPSDSNHPALNVLKYDETYWRPRGERESQSLTITLPAPISLTHVVLQEQLRLSQRIERFSVDVQRQGENTWTTVWPRSSSENDRLRASTVGFRKICRFDRVDNVRAIRINILESRLYPTLRFVGAYLDEDNTYSPDNFGS